MVSKCANSYCCAEFRYLGEGKLFEFTSESCREPSQLYWLCQTCCEVSTLERRPDGEIRLISKTPSSRRQSAKRSPADRINLDKAS